MKPPRPPWRLALYGRVSSKEQAKNLTIKSQVAELQETIATVEGILCPNDCYIDEFYSGETFLRPELDRLRDSIAAGQIDRLYVYDIDRLARGFALQVLLLTEFRQKGVEVIFLHGPKGDDSPEAQLQERVQGAFAEYERLKIRERSRRGKMYAARQGRANVLSNAPYGYRYIDKDQGGGQASYQIVLEEARVVRQIFQWISQERLSLRQVCKRLHEQQIPSPKGNSRWSAKTVGGMLGNPAYKGQAGYGKTHIGERRPRVRPSRGQPKFPHRVGSVYKTPDKAIAIPVPALVSEDVFAAVAEQLAENKKRHREQAHKGECKYILSGLAACKQCGYAMYGKPAGRIKDGPRRRYSYYRCRGSDGNRFGGQRICSNKAIRSDLLEEAVWNDICALLSDPEMIEREWQRREESADKQGCERAKEENPAKQKALKQGMDRLLDAYTEGYCSKEQFEAKMAALRKRLEILQGEEAQRLELQEQKEALRLLINDLDALRKDVALGLEKAGPVLKKNILRRLVSVVELDNLDVNVVYRIALPPFDCGAAQPLFPHCYRSAYHYSAACAH
jgi:site-specific DNA recombinase